MPMTAREKFTYLSARTVANGCTPAEAATAKARVDQLLADHPELAKPEEPKFVHRPNWNNPFTGMTPNEFAAWMHRSVYEAAKREQAMRAQAKAAADIRAAYEARRARQANVEEALRRERARQAAEEAEALRRARASQPRNVKFYTIFRHANEARGHEGKTAVLRNAARDFRYYGFTRKEFIEFAVDVEGYNRDTASTQWSRSERQE
jgi:hypothetical protein